MIINNNNREYMHICMQSARKTAHTHTEQAGIEGGKSTFKKDLPC